MTSTTAQAPLLPCDTLRADLDREDPVAASPSIPKRSTSTMQTSEPCSPIASTPPAGPLPSAAPVAASAAAGTLPADEAVPDPVTSTIAAGAPSPEMRPARTTAPTGPFAVAAPSTSPSRSARPTCRGDGWPETLHIVAWVDPLIDRLGYDSRSTYVETFWLGVLGPSTTWFLRRIAMWLTACPDGFDISLEETAAALGIGGRSGRHAPLQRTLERCVTFGMAQRCDQTLAVRRRLPPLARRHLLRLPPSLQQLHEQTARQHHFATPRAQETSEATDRARQLALSLVRLGEDPPSAEQQLARWKIHPAAAHDAVAWAVAHDPSAVAEK